MPARGATSARGRNTQNAPLSQKDDYLLIIIVHWEHLLTAHSFSYIRLSIDLYFFYENVIIPNTPDSITLFIRPLPFSMLLTVFEFADKEIASKHAGSLPVSVVVLPIAIVVVSVSIVVLPLSMPFSSLELSLIDISIFVGYFSLTVIFAILEISLIVAIVFFVILATSTELTSLPVTSVHISVFILQDSLSVL